MKEVTKLVKHSGIYGLGIVANKAVGFLMIPVYTRFLVPRDYGVLEILDLVLFFSTTIAATGVFGAVFRFYAAYEEERDKKEVIAAALFYTAGSGLVCALVLIAAASPLAQAVLGSASYTHFVRIVALTFFFSVLCEVPLAYFRAREQSALFVGVGAARAVLGALMLVVALAALKWGVRGVVYANCVTNAIAGLTLFGFVLSQVPKRIVAQKLEEMLRYGLPLVLSGLASFVLVFSDRLFLRFFGHLSAVGVYALGYKMAMVVALVISGPFSLAWSWEQFEIAKGRNPGAIYAKVQTYQFFFSLCIGLGVAVMAKDALRILTPESYWAAAQFVPLIVLCYVLGNARLVMLSGILVRQLTHYLIPITALIVAIDLGLNYVLISRYLAMGAAIATLITYAAYLGLTYLVAQRVYSVRYEFGRGGIALGSAVLIYLASWRLNLGLVGSIAVNLMLLGLFAAILLKLLDRGERDMFLRMGFSLKERLQKSLTRARAA
jgi:O-antigen/teichoic acid export membrane protein